MNNENNNEKEMMMKDVNRLTIETANRLFATTTDAMDELKGKDSFSRAVKNELFCRLLPIQQMAWKRVAEHDAKETGYVRADFPNLVKMLYQDLYTLYHYGACKGRELPGIAWHLETNGVFAIDLKNCAVNMEHSVVDGDKKGKAFKVWLDAPVPATNSPESDDCPNKGRYDKFVGFACEWRDDHDNIEYYDVQLDAGNHSHQELIRDILAELDVTEEMANV